MKFQSLIFIPLIFLLSSIASSPQARANSYAAESLKDVLMAVVDASWDLPAGPHWRVFSGKMALQSCDSGQAQSVAEVISEGIDQFSYFFVDEDLPYEEALEELNAMVAAGELRICGNLVYFSSIRLALSLNPDR